MPRTLSLGTLSAAFFISTIATSAPVSNLTEPLNLSPDILAGLPIHSVTSAELDLGALQIVNNVQTPPINADNIVQIGDADFSFSTGEIYQEKGYQQIIASSDINTSINGNIITLSAPSGNNIISNTLNDFQGILGFSQNTGQASSISQSIVFQRQ